MATRSKLAVILHADVVGSTALVQKDERVAHERMQDAFRRFSETITAYGGITHELRGDALVAEFSRASDSVSASLAFQIANIERNAALPDDIRPGIRVGIALGEVVIADRTVTGTGVVLAQRLEQLAKPDGVTIQGSVYDSIPRRLPFDYENLGEQELKGFDERVRAYGVTVLKDDEIPAPEMTSTVRLVEKAPERPSMAVLPFDNLSRDPDQEFFAEGLTEDIITELSRLHWLFVISRNSSFSYRGQDQDPTVVGEELGVAYVLRGSVRQSGSRLRVSAELVRTETGQQLWAERYDRVLEDLFDLQDELTQKVVSTLEPNLLGIEAERVARRTPANLDAWECVVRALPLVWSFEERNYPPADDLLHRAITLDPEYAQARSALAVGHALRAWMGIGPDGSEHLHLARKKAREAFDLDGNDPFAHIALGLVYALSREHEAAVNTLEEALRLNPNSALAHRILAFALTWGGKGAEGLQSFEEANRRSPRDPLMRVGYAGGLATAYFVAGRYPECAQAAREAVHLRPDVPGHQRILAIGCAYTGDLDEARRALTRLRELQPNISQAWIRQYFPFVRQDDIERYVEGLRMAGLSD